MKAHLFPALLLIVPFSFLATFLAAVTTNPASTNDMSTSPGGDRTTYTAPYSQNFNGAWLPDSWYTPLGYQWFQYNSSWARCIFEQYNYGQETLLFSPTIQIPVGGYMYRLDFKWSHLYSVVWPYSGDDIARIEVINLAGMATDVIWQKRGSGFNSNDGASVSAPGSGVLESLDLTRYAGQSIYIVFIGTSGNGADWFIDDFNLHYVDTGINTYPSTQTFSSSTPSPPTGWRNPDSSTYWRWSGANAYGATGQGSIIDWDNWDTGTSTRLDTPFLNLGAYGGTLSFDHAYAHYAPYEPAYKDLQILSSTNGGNTFSLRTTFSGATGGNLITAPAVAGGIEFSPGSDQWATKTVQIPAGVNILRFQTQNQYASGYLYIDNVKFTKYLFPSGTGTEADPYCISNASEFNLIRNYLGSTSSRTYFKLTSDIDLTPYGTAWVPIGNNTSMFYGGLDGDGHTISNLKMASYGTYHGLFGMTGAGSLIKNLNLSSTCSVQGDADSGSIVGHNKGTIDNCSSAAAVKIGNATIGGGICGNHNAGTIINCTFSGTVSRSDVSVSAHSLGGIAGRNETGAVISNCSSSGSIIGSLWNGGLVGWNKGTINRSFSTGSVSANDNSNGGLVGQNEGAINNCYSQASVASSANNSGGLVGSHGAGSITNCYSTGTVSGGQRGGLIGASAGSVTSSYWDTQTSGLANSFGGTGKTTAQMKTQSTFTGWDFSIETTNGSNDYWSIWPTDNNGYPDLTWKYSNEIRSPILLSPADNAYGVNKDILTLNWSPNPVGQTPDHYTIYMVNGNSTQIMNPNFGGQHTFINYPGTYFNPVRDGGLTFNYDETWYWTVVAYSSAGTASPIPAPQSFHIQRSQFATESFEVGCINGTTTFPEWTQVIEVQSSYWTVNSSISGVLAPRTGSFDAYMYHSSGMPAISWLFRPISLTGGLSYDVELYARKQLDYNPDYATVGIYLGTDATFAAMTNTIAGQTYLETSGYKRVAGSFTPPSSGSYYLGIKGYLAGSSSDYICMDDITLKVTAPHPVTLNLPADQSTFVNTLASFSWTAQATGVVPSTYSICISTENPPTLADLKAVVDAPTTSYTLPVLLALQPATTYYWSVIAKGQEEFSTNNAIFSFTTMPVSVLTQDFEAGTIPGGWTVRNVDGGTKSWEVVNYNTITGTYSAAISVEPSRQNDDWLITPRLGVSETTADNFRFSLRKLYSNNPEAFEVLVSTTDTQPASFTLVGSGTIPDIQVFTPNYNLDAYGSALIYLAIRYRGNHENGIYLDDVFGPAVYSASNIDIAATSVTGSSAIGIGRTYAYKVNISNNDLALQTGYTVYLKCHSPEATIASFEMPALGSYASTTHTFSWTPDSFYLGDANLYAEVVLAGDTVPANNISPNLPVTIALQEMLDESFESGSLPADWTVLNIDGGASVWNVGGVNYAHSGSYSLNIVNDYVDLIDDWIITPPLLLSNTRTDMISFWMRGYIFEDTEPWQVMVSTTDTNPASFTVIDSGNLYSSDWIQKAYNLDAYGTAVVYIAIHFAGYVLDSMHLDDFEGPPIYTPSGNLDTPTLSISSSGGNISLNWTTVIGATEYRVLSSDDLVNWSSTTVYAPNHTLSVSAASSGRKFFKVTAWAASK